MKTTKQGNNSITFQSKLKYPAALILAASLTAGTVSTDNLSSESRRALQQLVAQNPAAARVKSKAVAVLVFPAINRQIKPKLTSYNANTGANPATPNTTNSKRTPTSVDISSRLIEQPDHEI